MHEYYEFVLSGASFYHHLQDKILSACTFAGLKASDRAQPVSGVQHVYANALRQALE
jgi:hypothetical protein